MQKLDDGDFAVGGRKREGSSVGSKKSWRFSCFPKRARYPWSVRNQKRRVITHYAACDISGPFLELELVSSLPEKEMHVRVQLMDIRVLHITFNSRNYVCIKVK